VRVELLDAFGNLCTNSAATVTVRLANNSGGATLGGTTTQPVVNGVATFTNLSLTKTGTGYKLQGTEGSLSVTSTAFSVSPAAAAGLVFLSRPTNTTAGSVISPAGTVRVVDTYGNTVTSSTAALTVALDSGPAGATLSGTLTVHAVRGVATFGNLVVSRPGTGYTLVVTSSRLTDATSDAFDVL
jgi:hypothetical protein